MVYNEIVDVNATNVKEVMEYVKKLHSWETSNVDNEKASECLRVIEGYMQVNSTMYVMSSIVSMICGYDIMYGSGVQDVDDIEKNIDAPVNVVLDGVMRNRDNQSLFRDIIAASDALVRNDNDITFLLLGLIFNSSYDIRANMSDNMKNAMAVEKMFYNTYEMCLNILMTVETILMDKDGPKVGNKGISELILEVGGHRFPTNTTEDTIAHMLYTEIIPRACLSIRGLYDVIYLVNRTKWYNDKPRDIQ